MKSIYNKIFNSKFFQTLYMLYKKFSITEKVYFLLLSAIFILSALYIVNSFNKTLMVNEPASGGSLTEGIIGTARFVNPVLAVSDLDKDLSSLIYSGLMKVNPDGDLIPDLAEGYEISADGLDYTFTLKENLSFSSGKKLSADDVVFTINKIQDNAIKSPKRPEFYDVTVQKVDDKTIEFILKKPYAPFLENLTVGVLPKYIWNNFNADQFTQSQYNLDPIGSGPFKIIRSDSAEKNKVITRINYDLSPFSGYALGKPFLSRLKIMLYPDESSLINAYYHGDIESMSSISPDKLSGLIKSATSVIETSPLPRVFGTFFNQSQAESLSYKEVRQALDLATEKSRIIDEVLSGYGKVLNGPIPIGLISVDEEKDNFNLEQAQSILKKAGWAVSSSTGILEKKISKTRTVQLKFTISTLNSPDLIKTAGILKEDWEKLGAKISIEPYEFGDLQQNIIRPRKFDALLYGMVIGRDIDLFAFWHSSQRNDPGLNIAMYANSKADKLLEDARKTIDTDKRITAYKNFEKEIQNDDPAVFLYSPDFIYIVPQKLQGQKLGQITLPYERFSNIEHWYIETNNLWKIFNIK